MVERSRSEICEAARSVYSSEKEARANLVVSYWREKYPEVTVEEVSEKFGIGQRSVYRYLSAAGCALPSRVRGKREMDMAKVRLAHELYAACGNKREVARRMGCSPPMVLKYLQVPVPSEKASD